MSTRKTISVFPGLEVEDIFGQVDNEVFGFAPSSTTKLPPPFPFPPLATGKVNVAQGKQDPASKQEPEEVFPPLIGFSTMPSFVSEEPPAAALGKNCLLPMIDNELGPLPLSQAQFSSSSFAQSSISLKSEKGWKPTVDNRQQYITVDFGSPREISGLTTKGVPGVGWVEAVTLSYSRDGRQWSKILGKDGTTPRVFPANFDSTTPVTQYLERMVEARYVRISPTRWHSSIGMRVELLGCYQPYSMAATTVLPGAFPTRAQDGESACSSCPGLSPPPQTCSCPGGALFDGARCVAAQECPCYVGQKRHAKSEVFTSPDCQDCLCLGAGQMACSPKECPPCPLGQHHEVSSSCGCICKECADTERLCSSSGQCLDASLWCDGVEHCAEDELDCPLLPQTPSTTQQSQTTSLFPERFSFDGALCPQPVNQCGEGLKPVETEVETLDGCPYYKCLPEESIGSCPPPACLPGHTVQMVTTSPRPSTKSGKLMAPDADVDDCPKYHCIPPGLVAPEEEDAVGVIVESRCRFQGRSLSTLDGLQLKLDLCHHTLLQSTTGQWSVQYHRKCNGVCDNMLQVNIGDQNLTLTEDLEVTVNENTYSSQQAQKLKSQADLFSVSQIGQTLVISSLKNQLWVEWHTDGTVEIGLPESSGRRVEGLCGNFNGVDSDDRAGRAGEALVSTNELVRAWEEPGYPSCKKDSCSADDKTKAFRLCNTIKFPPFSQCSSLVDKSAWLASCLDMTCDCLQKGGDSRECKCSALEDYVRQCRRHQPTIHLQDWRSMHLCPAECPEGLVHHDCFHHSCEQDCTSIRSGQSSCPPLQSGVCFPGCFCPSGLVRDGDTCIEPSHCSNCVCRQKSGLGYSTFDGKNARLKPDKTYTLATHPSQSGGSDFSVRVSTVDCSGKGRHKVCSKAISLLWAGHEARVESVGGNQATVYFDQLAETQLPVSKHGISIRLQTAHQYVIQLDQLHVKVKLNLENGEFSLSLPHSLHGGKLRGLCGDCNNVPEDDFSNEAGIILSGEEEFLQAWDLEAAKEDYEDGSGLVPDPSTPNPLDPWGLGPITGGQKGLKTTTPSVKSTLNPLDPWNLGPLGVPGIKGPDIKVQPGQSTLSPLSPWILGPKASTLNPLDPWNLGSEGVKGSELGFGPDQSTLRPLSPWNLGPFGGGAKEHKTTSAPVKSTINPLAPWNLGPLGGGVKGPDMTVGPGQSTLGPLLPWNLGRKPSTIDPLNPWSLGPVGGGKLGVDPSQSTLSPLSPWNLGPIGGGVKEPETSFTETTLSPWAMGPLDGIKGSKPTEKSSLDPLEIFGVVGKEQQKEGKSTQLPPWAFGRETTEPHLTSQSTRKPLAPWDLEVLGGGIKGVEPGQSTLNPFSPWNLGPKASTINPLDPWNIGPVESDGIKGPASSQSTINPLSPWNLGPIGGVPKGIETTAKPGQQEMLLPKEELFEEISKTPSKGSPISEAPWGTAIMTTPSSECSATTRAPCQALTSPALSRCSGLLDPAPYQAACERELCGGAIDPQEVVCQWAGEYAGQCLEDGLCVEWRRMLACPITTCQENEHFEECGPGCDLDCHQTSCSGDGGGPACYCDTHMVLLDGRCQPKSECGVCLDSEGGSKREGDAWQPDSCTQCSCTNATVSCTITACTPISCGLGSEAQTVGHEEGECCPRQVCVPTVGECSTPVAPDCGEFQQAVTVTGEDGCTHFVCECLTDCPAIAPPILFPGQELLPSQGCCGVPKIVCKEKKCPPAPSCPAPLMLEKTPGVCCPTHACIDPPDVCTYTIVEGDQAGRMVTKAVDEQWTDGACRTCTCDAPDPVMMNLLVSLGAKARGPEPTCTLQGCDDTDPSVSAKYVMEEVKVAGVCCPQYHRVACKDLEGNRREIGEEWKVGICKTARCAQGSAGGAELEMDMETCMTDCPAGSEYVPVEGSCCGRCSKPTQDCATVAGHGGKVGAVQLQVPGHGLCSNSAPVEGWVECLGHCTSSAAYNPGSGVLESKCSCCQAIGQKLLSVPLSCPDGHRRVMRLPVPTSCSCEACLHQSAPAALALPDQHLLTGAHYMELQPGMASISGEPRASGASIAGDLREEHPGAPAMITGDNPGAPAMITGDNPQAPAMIHGDISEKDIFGETL